MNSNLIVNGLNVQITYVLCESRGVNKSHSLTINITPKMWIGSHCSSGTMPIATPDSTPEDQSKVELLGNIVSSASRDTFLLHLDGGIVERLLDEL